METHVSSLDHPVQSFVRDVFRAIVECPYAYPEGPAWVDRTDVRICFAMQYLFRKSRVFSADDLRGHSVLAFRRASPCEVHLTPDGGLYGLVDLGRPETFEQAAGRLRSLAPLSSLDGFLMVFNAKRRCVRRAVEYHLMDVACPNWYVHYGSGLYLLGSAARGKL